MRLLSCLIDSSAVIVADTSAAINLSATGFAPQILGALPNEFVLLDAVCDELESGRALGRKDAECIKQLMSEKLVKIVTLGEMGLQHFEQLVVGPAANTLDDGEAATIAYAVETDSIALVDERKAIRICADKFQSLHMGSTVDLLAHPEVQKTLGEGCLKSAVLNALLKARMRVLPHYVDWVVDLIGPDQAALCNSLPRSVRSP